ncbi:MAG: hypothetical protein IE937_11645 [Gammaproteobacteria bacterium]|nr:hypothetical protein [Gammaproteobacteria bacterium]
MNKKSKLDHLAHKLRPWLWVAFLLLRIANEAAELVSKVVNYARQIRELHAFIPPKRQTCLCAV